MVPLPQGATVDVKQESDEFNEGLPLQPSELQSEVRAEISKIKFVAKQFIQSKIPFAKRILKRLLTQGKLNQPVIIRGSEAGLDNILESAHFLGYDLLPKSLKH